MRRNNMLAVAVMLAAKAQSRNVVGEHWPIHISPNATMPVSRSGTSDKAEAKRARKAQIKRNGGKK